MVAWYALVKCTNAKDTWEGYVMERCVKDRVVVCRGHVGDVGRMRASGTRWRCADAKGTRNA